MSRRRLTSRVSRSHGRAAAADSAAPDSDAPDHTAWDTASATTSEPLAGDMGALGEADVAGVEETREHRTGVDAIAADEELMPHHPAYWDVWREPIGRALLPVLEELHANLPGDATSTVAFTPDGLELAATRVDQKDAARIGGLTAQAFALLEAASAGTGGGHEGASPIDLVSVTGAEARAVVVAVRNLIVGTLLIWVSSDGPNLGVITFQAKSAAEKVAALLAKDESSGHRPQHAATLDEPAPESHGTAEHAPAHTPEHINEQFNEAHHQGEQAS